MYIINYACGTCEMCASKLHETWASELHILFDCQREECALICQRAML